MSIFSYRLQVSIHILIFILAFGTATTSSANAAENEDGPSVKKPPIAKFEVPTHKWIGYQAYLALEGTSFEQEVNALGALGQYNATFGECNEANSGTQILEGMAEEDDICLLTDRPQSFDADLRPLQHFWKPDDGYNAGVLGNISALEKAQNLWSIAVNLYPSNKRLAFWYLGRVAHLLEDMACPPHTHLDTHNEHAGEDSLEKWLNFKNVHERITFRSLGAEVQNAFLLPAYPLPVPTRFDPALSRLFYHLAAFARNFDSDDSGHLDITGIPIAQSLGQRGEFNNYHYRIDVGHDFSGKPTKVTWFRQTRNGDTSSAESSIELVMGIDFESDERQNFIYLYDHIGLEFDEAYFDPKHDILEVVDSFGPSKYTRMETALAGGRFSIIPTSVLERKHQPLLESRAIGSVAGLFSLFWSRTHSFVTGPVINELSPRTLQGKPIPQTQPITITGTGFSEASRLTFDDGLNPPLTNRIPTSWSPTQLTYDIPVGIRQSEWRAKVVNGLIESMPYTFFVVSTSGPSLTGISITGPSAITENSGGQFAAVALFSDGTSQTVTTTASWEEDSGMTSISQSGFLTAGSVVGNVTVTVSARYATGGITKTAHAEVIVVNATNGGGSQTTDVIVNGSFEAGDSPWGTPNGNADVVSLSYPHGGSWYGYIGNANNAVGAIAQFFPIPAGTTSARLSFYLDIVTIETAVNSRFDTMKVDLVTGNDELVGTVAEFSNLDKGDNVNGTYVLKSYDIYSLIQPYRGRSLYLVFSGQTDDSRSTIFRLDDVSLEVITPEPVTLTGLSIGGPSSILEGHAEAFYALAVFSDGTTQSVSPNSWNENSSSTTISNDGFVVTSPVNGDTSVILSASYTFNGITQQATKAITVVDGVAPVTFSYLAITGPTSVDENSSVQFAASAIFSDGSSQSISAIWSEDSSAATISNSGTLTIGDVNEDTTLTVGATFTTEGQTRIASHVIRVRDAIVPPSLADLNIVGPASASEKTTTQFSAVATFSDGSSQFVEATWGENSSIISISPLGLLSAGEVSQNTSISITATFAAGNVTRSATFELLILDSFAPRTLLSISIDGPSSLLENSTVKLTLTGSFSDGTSEAVVATWSDDSTIASVSASGDLAAGEVGEDTTVIVTAFYAGENVIHTATKGVLVRNVVPALFTLSIQSEHGTVAKQPDQQMYAPNTQVTLIATGSSGYSFRGWTEHGTVVSTSASYSFTINGDRSLVANFAPDEGCAAATSGLVAWWKGEADGGDSQSGNIGVVHSVRFTSSKVGNGFEFSGTGSYLEIPDSSSLHTPSAMTLEMWINPTEANAYHYLFTKAGFSYKDWNLYLWKGGLHAEFLDPSSTRNEDGVGLDTPDGIITAGVYSHVAVTLDTQSHVAEIFVNGISVAQGTFPALSALRATPGAVFIGSGAGGATGFQGNIDEVSLYNRALTLGEIRAVFDAGSAGKCAQVGNRIAFESGTSGYHNTGGTTRTVPFTVSGTNTLLVVGWGHDDNGKITSVTFDGIPLNSLGVQPFDTFRPINFNVGLFYLLNPHSGTHDLMISRDISTSTMDYVVSLYSGIEQSEPEMVTMGASNMPALTHRAMAVTQTPAAWLIGSIYNDKAISSVSTGMLIRGLSPDQTAVVDSSSGLLPGEHEVSWNLTEEGRGGWILASFTPSRQSQPPVVEVNHLSEVHLNRSILQFRLNGKPQHFYLIEESNDLAVWTEHGTYQIPASGFVILNEPIGETKYFRARAAQSISFSDSFNRPDSDTIGNGWHISDAEGTSLVLRSGVVTTRRIDESGAGGGTLYRGMSMSLPLTVSIKFSQISGFGGVPNRFANSLAVLSSGGHGGYRLSINRGDSNYKDSAITLLDGDEIVQTWTSSFQFNQFVNVVATFGSDGSVIGKVSDDAESFDFSLSPRSIVSQGSDFSFFLGMPDDRGSSPIYATADDFSATPK